MLHRLSCVMACPPPEAWDVACAVLSTLYAERNVGITFGGSGIPERGDEYELRGYLGGHIVDLDGKAPSDLEAHADATWGDRNVYGLLLTYNGGVIYHVTKKIALIVDSSMETEVIASAKAGEQVSVAREILRAFGTPCERPTLIGTDNLANMKVATGVGCPSRSRHFLRRYAVLKRRISEGEVTLMHVPDAEMPADVLTKWIPMSKVNQSVKYMTNADKAPAATCSAAAIPYDLIALDQAIANLSESGPVPAADLSARSFAPAANMSACGLVPAAVCSSSSSSSSRATYATVLRSHGPPTTRHPGLPTQAGGSVVGRGSPRKV